MKVLYIEDNPFDADLTKIELKKRAPGIDLTHVPTIQEALDLIRDVNSNQYDIILTDMNLTDGSGLTLLAEVRKLGIPAAVVVVTGQGDEETAVAALKAGADDYIIKHKDYIKSLPETLDAAIVRFKKIKNRLARPIKVLYAEHNAVDIDLTLRHLKTHAPHIQMDIVKDSFHMMKLLKEATPDSKYDVLLIDFHLPGEDMLTLVKSIIEDTRYEYPIVLITGQGNEETAVNVLKLGVVDYLVKADGYLYRLPSILENAHNLLDLAHEKEALAQSEAQFRLLAENARDVIFRLIFSPSVHFEYISPSVTAISGFSPEEIYENPQPILNAAREKIISLKNFLNLISQSPATELVFPFTTKEGRRIILEMRGHVNKTNKGLPDSLEGIARDITDRIEIENMLQNRMHRLNALHTIDTAINSSFDLKFTYQVLIEQVISLTRASAGCIIFFDSGANVKRPIACVGFETSNDEISRFLIDDPLTEGAFLQRRMVLVSPNELKDQPESSILHATLRNEGISNYCAVPLIVKGYVKGVLEIFFSDPTSLDPETTTFIETIAQQAAIALESSQNFERLQKSNQELLQAYDDTLAGWVNFLDLRDKETEGHTMRVVDATVKVCKSFGFSSEELLQINRGVVLHDIGKVGVPDQILNKPGPLTDEEWLIMKKHPVYAYQMLYPISYLRPALDIPYCHHEKWDGSGYPRGLKGKEIPLSARIFSIIDVYDALTSDRPYRKAWTVKATVQYLRDNAGTAFDPEILEKCLAVLSSQED